MILTMLLIVALYRYSPCFIHFVAAVAHKIFSSMAPPSVGAAERRLLDGFCVGLGVRPERVHILQFWVMFWIAGP